MFWGIRRPPLVVSQTVAMLRFSKFLAALAGALTVTGVALGDGSVSVAELGTIGAAWVAAFAVFQVKNTPA
jgi:hypothetical protein